jgi:nucleotide-binding universal stress UspA family protein
MPTIVVGYDGSHAARAAVELAVDRTGPDGELIVVHTVKMPADYIGAPQYQVLVNRELSRAGATMDEFERDCPSVTTVSYEPDVIEGAPAEALCRVARKRHADEIVIGTRGLGRARGLLGSVAHEVLHLAECPVLVVPDRAIRARHKERAETASAASIPKGTD